MARADTPTLLALDRWAEIMGLNPAHFSQAVGVDILPAIGSCGDVFWQYPYQSSGRVSREDIAREIAIAEEDIANQIGYWPAPVWIAGEMVRYERPYRRDYYSGGLDARGQWKSVQTALGRLIQGGRRAVQLVGGNVVVGYSDDDHDGYDETATVSCATTLTQACNIKVYFDGHSSPEWEIRPARTKAIVGGIFTATFWSWQLIDPTLQNALPTQPQPLAENLEGAIYVTQVDVFREYNDYSKPSAIFYWEQKPGGCSSSNCAACQLDAQPGCFYVRDYATGIGVPVPGTYSASDGTWTAGTLEACRAPDLVKVYYQAGDVSNRFKQNLSCDPLSDYWAETITWLATARLGRPLCSCNQVTLLAYALQEDLAQSGANEPVHQLGTDDLDNPFGTRRGEVRAWRRVSRIMRDRGRVAVI